MENRDTSGRFVWSSSRRLLEFLAEDRTLQRLIVRPAYSEDVSGQEAASQRSSVDVLELGSGSGWLASEAIQSFLGDAQHTRPSSRLVFVATEQHGLATERLCHGITRFVDEREGEASIIKHVHIPFLPSGLTLSGSDGDDTTLVRDDVASSWENIVSGAEDTPRVRVITGPLDWTDFASSGRERTGEKVLQKTNTFLDRQYDLILGADLVYNEVGSKYLPHVLRRALMAPKSFSDTILRNAEVFYAQPFPRFQKSSSEKHRGDGVFLSSRCECDGITSVQDEATKSELSDSESMDSEILDWVNQDFERIFAEFLENCSELGLELEEYTFRPGAEGDSGAGGDLQKHRKERCWVSARSAILRSNFFSETRTAIFRIKIRNDIGAPT